MTRFILTQDITSPQKGVLAKAGTVVKELSRDENGMLVEMQNGHASFYVDFEEIKPAGFLANEQLLNVAHTAAAISDSVHTAPSHLLRRLTNHLGEGFPGVWMLCARAAAALEDAFVEAGDPGHAEYEFIECVDHFADILLGESADWRDDNVLMEKARFVLERNKIGGD